MVAHHLGSVVLACALASLAGCVCARSGVGEGCEASSDCQVGLLCDPGTRTCQPAGGDGGDPSLDAANGTDGAANGTDGAMSGTDGAMSGTDGAPGADSAPADAGPSCGDGTCDAGEDCTSCAADCGACPTCSPAGTMGCLDGTADACCAGLSCCCGSVCSPASAGTCQAMCPVG